MRLISSIFNRLFGKKQVRILMVGLDATGKTTILYKLKLGEIVQTIPTIGFNVEIVEHKNISFTVYDVTGQERLRPLWRHYFVEGVENNVIFVVDCNDRERISEAKDAFLRLLMADWCSDAAFLILANKQDLPDAMSAAELTESLGLRSHTDKRWYVQATSATKGEGLYEGLDWLCNEVTKSS